MKKIYYKFAWCIATLFIACNTQKSVDPTGQTPIPIGTEKPLDPDTTITDEDTTGTLPDTLMKDSL